jgi:hypothetical protein
MSLEDDLSWLADAAAAFVCRRHIDFMLDVHVVGQVEDADGRPVSDVALYVAPSHTRRRSAHLRPLAFVGASAADGRLDAAFRFVWGQTFPWHDGPPEPRVSLLLHLVHDAFEVAVVPVTAQGVARSLVSEVRVVLAPLSNEEAIVVQKKGSRSQYLRKRDPDPGDPGESWDPDQPWPHEAPFGGDTFSIGGDCGDQTQRIVDGVRWAYWQLRDGKIVTDPGLRACIMDHMNNASLTCGGGSCSGAVNGYNDENLFFRSSNIVVCVPQVRTLSTPDIGRLAIHEWAHSCGWDHGDGKGVPGDSGVGLA